MTEKKQIYKCEICGNIVEVLHEGNGKLVCCGKPMELYEEKTADSTKEKHVPVIEKMGDKVKVKIGSTPHPMEEKHFIEWIELIVDGKSYRQFLKSGDSPEATFDVKVDDGMKLEAREYCNIHGLWRG